MTLTESNHQKDLTLRSINCELSPKQDEPCLVCRYDRAKTPTGTCSFCGNTPRIHAPWTAEQILQRES